jgi:hypothetical protein
VATSIRALISYRFSWMGPTCGRRQRKRRWTSRIDDGPYDYGDLVGWDVGATCPRTETVVCVQFDALS